MRIAVLVKQIPKFEEMELGPDGRLRRDGIEPEMNPYCRRAVSQGRGARGRARRARRSPCSRSGRRPPTTRCAKRSRGGSTATSTSAACTSPTPRSRAPTRSRPRKALAAALDRSRARSTSCSPAATRSTPTPARSGPELAELLDLPFLTGVRHLAYLPATLVDARCEHDDGWMQAEVELPAVLSCAERLCEPAKVDPPGRAAVPGRPHPPAVGRRPRRRARGARTRRPRGSGR